MQTLTITPSADDPGGRDDEEPPFLEVEGIEGSMLRATATSLVVLRRPGALPLEIIWNRMGSHAETRQSA